MRIEQFQDAEVVAASSHIDIMTGALQKIFGSGMTIRFEAEIEGKISARVFGVEPCFGEPPLENPISPWWAANHLRSYTKTARWPPSPVPKENPDSAARKLNRGWEIRKMEVDGKPIAIAFAAWVEDW